VEYALILAFISVVAISVLIALGRQVKGVFTTISSQLGYAGSSH
jgi:Flp pilus assembly pilin Flp